MSADGGAVGRAESTSLVGSWVWIIELSISLWQFPYTTSSKERIGASAQGGCGQCLWKTLHQRDRRIGHHPAPCSLLCPPLVT